MWSKPLFIAVLCIFKPYPELHGQHRLEDKRGWCQFGEVGRRKQIWKKLRGGARWISQHLRGRVEGEYGQNALSGILNKLVKNYFERQKQLSNKQELLVKSSCHSFLPFKAIIQLPYWFSSTLVTVQTPLLTVRKNCEHKVTTLNSSMCLGLGKRLSASAWVLLYNLSSRITWLIFQRKKSVAFLMGNLHPWNALWTPLGWLSWEPLPRFFVMVPVWEHLIFQRKGEWN